MLCNTNCIPEAWTERRKIRGHLEFFGLHMCVYWTWIAYFWWRFDWASWRSENSIVIFAT